MGTVHRVLGVHSVPFTEILLLNISIRKLKDLLVHFAQAISVIHKVKNSTKVFIFTYEHFRTDREIDKKVVDGLFHAEEVGNKHFEAFLLEKLLKNKKSLFQSFCEESIVTGNKKNKKKFLKPLSVVKEVCQAFGLLVNKAVKFTEALKSAITSVPPAVAVLNPKLYQTDKSG